jgi:hypothetical protein
MLISKFGIVYGSVILQNTANDLPLVVSELPPAVRDGLQQVPRWVNNPED